MYLIHYGTPQERDFDPQGSGRYRQGSGKRPNQHLPYMEDVAYRLGRVRAQSKVGLKKDSVPSEGEDHKTFFVDEVDAKRRELREAGLPSDEKSLADAMGMSSTEYRNRKTASTEERKAWRRVQIEHCLERGMSKAAIARQLHVTPSTVDNYIKGVHKSKEGKVANTAKVIKEACDANRFVDIGLGVYAQMGVSEQTFNGAISMLKDQGYQARWVEQPQMGTGHFTNRRILVKPGEKWNEAKKDPTLIKPVTEYTRNMGRTFEKPEPPVSVDSSRVQIRYGEEGSARDGLIELRRGAKDLTLGSATYAQVRIAVNDTHYIKGMAVYSDDLPDGVDIRFNTSKSSDKPMIDPNPKKCVLKPMKEDPENRFGATISRQNHYIDDDGNSKLSPINIVNEEGYWQENWSNTLAAQFLSKQSPSLAKQQLDKLYDQRKAEYDEIMAYDNPVVRERFLERFASQCDSDAVHLKAAAMPRQAWNAILPVPSLKPNEVYAPGYEQGETVIMIRYPHGGKFEIPQCVVNNKNKEAIALMGRHPRDAIGINPITAQQLSGADYDGDTVLVIPNNDGAIQVKKYHDELINFDHHRLYQAYDGMPEVGKEDGFNRGMRMGDITNLICDMTIKGAGDDEIIRAVKYSMVIIDAEKHNLDWKTAKKDLRIDELKKAYQGRANAGASTLISKSTSPEHPYDRKKGVRFIDPETGKPGKVVNIDPVTGQPLFSETGKTRFKPKKTHVDEETGAVIVDEWGEERRKGKSNKMTEALLTTGDARALSSGTAIEEVYAAHANRMFELGNKARLATLQVEKTYVNKEAKQKYATEVEEMMKAIREGIMNAPLEREAQALAYAMSKAETDETGHVDYDTRKKMDAKNLTRARARVGSGRTPFYITDRQWEAIQAGALAQSNQEKLFQYADQDRLRELASPPKQSALSSAQISKAREWLDSEKYTQKEIADQFGVSVTTLLKAVNA